MPANHGPTAVAADIGQPATGGARAQGPDARRSHRGNRLGQTVRTAPTRHSAGDRFIKLGFLCALGILTAIGAFSYYSIKSFLAREAAVTASHEILAETETVLTLALDAETALRGYLLTGREGFLEPYLAAKTRFRLALRELGQALAAHPAHHDRFVRLRALVEKRFTQIDAMIARKRKAAPERETQARLWEGKLVMDSIRQIVADVRDHEQALLARRAEEARLSVRSTIAVIALGSLGSFTLLIGGFALLRRENRPRARNGLPASNEVLEQQIGERTVELAQSDRQLARDRSAPAGAGGDRDHQRGPGGAGCPAHRATGGQQQGAGKLQLFRIARSAFAAARGRRVFPDVAGGLRGAAG